ncbi:hypothetical protein [Butyrivibrio sp. VCB2006]|uniref:hypothetical protein n=1 Tax=Butyrivibrio sp. VCB2006 TaxID=1280679 RepID=UPI00041553D5|nr:hypothetical protein [Butyrivibrio sp. VCB2006]
MDTETRTKLRKYNSNIGISGLFVILYSLWVAIKLVLSIKYGSESLQDIFDVDEAELGDLVIVFWALIFILCIIIILFHFRIGFGAINFSKAFDITGKKKRRARKGFLVWATIYAVLNFFGLFAYFRTPIDMQEIDTVVVSILLDITFTFILFDMIYSSFKVLSIQKELKKG